MRKSEAQYLAMNRVGWDRRAQVHIDSRFYDVNGFIAGATSLREIEQAELAGVAGKTLLHLQCHFGLDTLSWAREGAICTGVDNNEFPYSPYNCFEGMVEREPGRFYLSHKGNDVPIVYSISGRKVT